MWDLLIVNPFTNVLLLIYAFVGNFGIAIILFTILIRLVTHPFMASQIKSTTAMQELMQSDEYKKIQEKYKNDKEKLGQEQMRLYQEHGINPLGSCLPTLIQFPIIFGLYESIIRAIGTTPLSLLQLVRTIYPWMEGITKAASLSALIPVQTQFLWMNLGEPERVFVPFLPFGIPVLAIIVGITTYIQSKLTVPPTSGPGDQGAQMTKMMSIYMPLLLFYFSLNYASGLAVYFVASNVAGIAQYAMLGKVNWNGLFSFSSPAPAPPPAKGKAGKRT